MFEEHLVPRFVFGSDLAKVFALSEDVVIVQFFLLKVIVLKIVCPCVRHKEFSTNHPVDLF